MKTTFDLPDDLVSKAEQLALRRGITVKDLIARSLQREIEMEPSTPPDPNLYTLLASGDLDEVEAYLDRLGQPRR